MLLCYKEWALKLSAILDCQVQKQQINHMNVQSLSEPWIASTVHDQAWNCLHKQIINAVKHSIMHSIKYQRCDFNAGPNIDHWHSHNSKFHH